MILKTVNIKNFKSIHECTIDITRGCKIFVGLSESGKSNLLLALSTLDNSVKLTKEFIKEGTRSSQESNIEFIMLMSEDEQIEFYKKAQEKIYSSKKDSFIMFNGKYVKLLDFLDFNYVYDIDIRKSERLLKYYILDNDDKYIINDNLKFLNATPENPISIINKETQEQHEIKEKIIINIDEYDVSSENLIKIVAEDLHDYFCELGMKIANNNIPDVLFWEYKDEYLLPASITIKSFIENPNINIPLKYIFELNNIANIKEEYNECKEMGEASFQNLLDEVSEKTTIYLRKIWKSMPKNCKLELRENVDNINIRIRDTNNSYLLDKRSDGFKRLITYMIMLSVKNKNKQLNNTLILIDEPETKIDIPGQEYLKEELINIGKNNYVFYSTHSTSMIDTTNIGRHYIVTKDSECTSIEEANESNYDNAKTLYNALGMKVYAIINDKNLVFEGWIDKHLFHVALNKLNKTKKNKFKKVGLTHVPGATKFREFASLWGLLAKDYYIISDADEVSSDQKKVFEQERYAGKWYKYDEFNIDRLISTCEDFYTPKYIITESNKFGDRNAFKVKINTEKINDESVANISVIEEWIRYNETDSKKAKKLIKDFKVTLAENVTKTNISDDYIRIFDKLIELLNL